MSAIGRVANEFSNPNLLRLPIDQFKERLRIVVIDSPYDYWNDSQVTDFLLKVFRLKLAGYQAEYRDGVLPLDTGDFFASHLVLAEILPMVLSPLWP